MHEQVQEMLKLLSYATISAISKIYYSIYRINLQTWHFEEISGNDGKLLGADGEDRFDKAVQSLEEFIIDEHVPYADRFMDITTLADRLMEEDSIALEYKVKDSNWICRMPMKIRLQTQESMMQS